MRLIEGSSIGGNLYVGAARVILNGKVVGTLHGGAERITLRGEIAGGDVELGASGMLDIDDSARILGDFRYVSSESIVAPAGAEILGTLTHVPLAVAAEEEKGFSFLMFLWCLVASMIVGLVLLTIAGSWMRASAAGFTSNAGPAFGWGVLLLVGTPIAVGLVMITIVGIPLGLLGAGAYLAALYIAPLPLSLWFGDWLLRKMGRAAPGAFLSLSLGLLVYKILSSIPLLGYIAVAFVRVLGLGAMLQGCRHVRNELNA